LTVIPQIKGKKPDLPLPITGHNSVEYTLEQEKFLKQASMGMLAGPGCVVSIVRRLFTV
jgi:hypothetical protein